MSSLPCDVVKRLLPLLLLLITAAPPALPARAQDCEVCAALSWRLVGPFRAGRTVGAAGVPQRPGTFYIGVNNGGVWKTDDYGRTWEPIFDRESTGSVGDIAVAPSDPDVIYVGTGEGLHRPDLSTGDGMFRSTDAGRTWTHIGLDDARQIAGIAVHPDDPDRVLVAAMGSPYGPTGEKGVYRTTDGGRTWSRVLYVDEHTRAMQVTYDPVRPDIVYADLWAHQEGPWENAAWSGATSGLYKSVDGGTTWKRLEGGLPTAEMGLGRVGFAIAPSLPDRVFATVEAREGSGIYRSEDAGETWTLVSTDERVFDRGSDFAEIKVDPKNPDRVYTGSIASYRSDDGGRTWFSLKGAPGGDDYHRIWIHPDEPDIMLFATDQGATITVNGGRTWSSWYNQPTAQLYHVTTDDRFPYRVYGGQQESGAIMISSRSNGGQISFRDWVGVGADEYAYVAPDPLNPRYVYGGRVVRHDLETGQTKSVAPEALRSGTYRILRTMPLAFHPADPATLYFGTNVLFRTRNGGDSWDIVSPDLSREQPEVGESFPQWEGPAPRRGVIYSLGLSPLDADVIWAGTDDGLVHVTWDGGATWKDVTPPGMSSWDKVAQIDAGHFEKGTAYLAVNAFRKNDLRAHVYVTHDFGATWAHRAEGLPDDAPVNAVREDPKRPGLLYAATEKTVHASLDDGRTWFSLRLNLPPSSMRDLVVKDDDLVVGTHGRSIWILDNVTPLRQAADAATATGAYLFEPQLATRVRWNMFSDTPLPPEEPTGENPPDGAAIDYLLRADAKSVTLEILGPGGAVVRRYTNHDLSMAPDTTGLPHPTYWIRPEQQLSARAGMHRFHWDLRHEPPRGARRSYQIAAVLRNTESSPNGPWVLPGTYTVRLTVDGVASERKIAVRMDPRVTTTPDDWRAQSEVSLRTMAAYDRAQAAREEALAASARFGAAATDGRRLSRRSREAVRLAMEEAAAIAGAGDPGAADIAYGSATETPAERETLSGVQTKLIYLLTVVQNADERPTAQALDGIARLEAITDAVLARWQRVKTGSVARAERALR